VEPSSRRPEGMSYIIRTLEGDVVLRSPAADTAIFGSLPVPGFRVSADYRIFGRPVGDGTILEVADPLEERRDATLDALKTLVRPAALLTPVLFFGVYWFVGYRLRPVAQLTEQVAKKDPGNLDPLATSGLQVELIPIQNAVNRLMSRLSDALAAERSFSANAAHELRTPIAATLAHTQRLIVEAPDGPLHVRAQTIEAELKRMARLSEKLLDLARAEAAGVTAGSAQDLRAVLSLVMEDFGGGQDLCLSLPALPVVARIDPDAFAILARNLVENAILHGAPPVEVVLEGNGTLRVTNGGPVLRPETIANLTRRFERAGSQRQGAGLGLAIVEALVRNANARLQLDSPAPGRRDGLAAVVVLADG
jgi:two-component system OmpR family sensor kinase